MGSAAPAGTARRLRLRGPFLTLVLTLLMAVSASTIAGFAGIGSLDRTLRETVDGEVRRLLLATHVRRLFRSELVLVLELDGVQDPRQREELQRRRQLVLVERGARLRELRDLGVPGQEAALATLLEEHQAAALSRPRQPRWEAAVASVLALAEGRLARAEERAESQGRLARRLLIGVSTLAAALAVSLGTVVLRRVRAASRALSASEQQFRCVVESAPSLLAILAPSQRLEFLPARGPAFLGVAGERLREEPLCWVHPDDRAELRARIDQVAKGPGAPSPVQLRSVRGVRDDGGQWNAAVSLTPLREDAGALSGVVVQILDVTPQHQAEAARRALEEQLRQAQKMESVGRLAGGVAHDFNNLLTAISGYASLAQLPRNHPRVPEYVAGIAEAAERASALTRQLLAFSRKHVIAPVPTALDQLVQRLQAMLARIIGEDVSLEVRSAPDLGVCLVDPNQVEQVILNLVVNGRDAMPNGGRLLLEVRNATVDEQYAALHPDTKPGRYVLLAVTDTGIGMAQEVHSRLFEPFFTTKPRGRGTGLGLSVVYGTVRQHGGSIRVDSEPGRGTTVSIYWPRIEADVEVPAALPASAGRRSGSETILLVEDDPLVRSYTVDALQTHGYEVLVGGSAGEARRLAERRPVAPGLLLTDMILPDGNGRALADELLRRWPAMPVLFCSGYTERLLDDSGRLPPGVDFLPKPYDTATLLDRVRAAIDSATAQAV